MERKYKFVQPSSKSLYDKNLTEEEMRRINYFYQVTEFAHPRNKLHQLRRYAINYNNEIVNTDEFYLTEDQYKRFLKEKKNNQFKQYSTFSLQDVKPPSMADINMMRSTILEKNFNYYGFAPCL